MPGIMGLPLTANREDRHLLVNHYGPYLLTRLLLPALAPGARVVFVASRAHEQGRLTVRSGRVEGTPPHWCCLQLTSPYPLSGDASLPSHACSMGPVCNAKQRSCAAACACEGACNRLRFTPQHGRTSAAFSVKWGLLRDMQVPAVCALQALQRADGGGAAAMIRSAPVA